MGWWACRTAVTASSGAGPSDTSSAVLRRSTTVVRPMSPTSLATSDGESSCRLSPRNSLPAAVSPPSCVAKPPRSRTLAALSSSIHGTTLVAGTDVVVVFVHHVHRRLLGRRRAAVDPGVASDEIGLGVWVGAFILGHQPVRARIRAVVKQQPVQVLVGRIRVAGEVLLIFVVDVEGDVGLLLGELVIERLAGLLLAGRSAVPYPGRPPFRDDHAPVQRIIAGIPDERVGGVLHLVVLKIGGFVRGLVGHRLRSFRRSRLSWPRLDNESSRDPLCPTAVPLRTRGRPQRRSTLMHVHVLARMEGPVH